MLVWLLCVVGVQNTDFWYGQAEKELKLILQKCTEEDKVVAIINPGRGGIGKFLLVYYINTGSMSWLYVLLLP